MKHLVPKDYPKYSAYFENLRYRLCGYSLSSIIAWSNEEYQPYGMLRDNTLIVGAEFVHEKHNRHLILPISPQGEYPPEALADLARELGFDTYWFVTQGYIDRFGETRLKKAFRIEHHAAYDDYVFNREDLAFLKGNKFAKKRNLINQFEREYLENDRVRVADIGPDDIEDCLVFLEKWCEAHDDCDGAVNHDLACEKQAAINSLLNMEVMQLRGLLVRLDNEVSGFGIASGLTRDMATLQYEKAFGHIKGLYQYLDRECARRLFEGYTYINKESDMGIPGIAKAKKSYHPVMKIKCHKLLLR